MKRICLVLAVLSIVCGTASADEPEVLSLKARDGFVLAATYQAPPTKPGGCVVLVHMLSGRRQDWGDFPAELAKAGWGVLALDMRGHGESKAGGKVDIEKLNERTAAPLCAKMPLDVEAAVEFVRQREDVKPDRIVVIGASIAANSALQVAARSPAVAAVALLSPGLDYLGVTTADAMRKCTRRKVLMVAAALDEPSAECVTTLAKIAKGSPSVQSRVFDTKLSMGANMQPEVPHGTDLLRLEPELRPLLMKWLAETFPPAEPGAKQD